MINKNYYLLQEEKYHDEAAEKYTLRREKDYIWEIPEELFLLRIKYFRKGAKIIDMGCGPAVSISNVIPKEILSTCKYIGVDISKNLLKFAAKNIPHGEFVKGDISNIKFPYNFADIIISLGALHHVDDKNKAISHWIKILKKNGLILLREPTHEALKRGFGESPIEEGIRVRDLVSFLKKENVKIIRLIYFSSPAFHFFNRIMIKISLNSWQNVRSLWYPVILMDYFLCKVSGKFSFFKGQAFAMIIQKL